MNVTNRIPALPLNIFLGTSSVFAFTPLFKHRLAPSTAAQQLHWLARWLDLSPCQLQQLWSIFFSPQRFVFFPVARCFDADVMAAQGGVSFFEFLVCVFSPWKSLWNTGRFARSWSLLETHASIFKSRMWVMSQSSPLLEVLLKQSQYHQ